MRAATAARLLAQPVAFADPHVADADGGAKHAGPVTNDSHHNADHANPDASHHQPVTDNDGQRHRGHPDPFSDRDADSVRRHPGADPHADVHLRLRPDEAPREDADKHADKHADKDAVGHANVG